MRKALALHSDFACTAVSRIEVEAVRPESGRLVLRYVLGGSLGEIALPSPAAPMRADGLWKHTCFEAFLRVPGETAYHEFNFSPSGEWAAYRLSGYREGMAEAGIDPPQMKLRSDDNALELRVQLDLSVITEFAGADTWQLGVSAVIEEANGGKSYWALAHAPGAPDFHHSDCFALELPAAA